MALPNTLFYTLFSLLILYNVGKGQPKALNEFINYYEPVFFDGNAKIDFGYHDLTLAEGAEAQSIAKDVRLNAAKVTEQIDIRAFGRVFKLELNRSVTVLSSEANVTIMGGKDSCITEKLDPNTIIPNLVEGRVVNEPLSFVHGVLIKGVFTGVIHLPNQTLFVERASKYFRDRMPFESVIFRQEDLNMTAVDCEIGPEGYKCDPIRLLHRRGPGVEQVLSLARSERTWFKQKMRPKTTCSLKVIADHLFTKHAGDGSALNAIYEMIFHVQEADHIYRKTDFDQDGHDDNVGFKIYEITVQSSPICLENRAFMKPKLTSDQYLEIFSEYDFENYCVGIAFSGYTFPGRILGIAWMADADESGYVGGICEPRLFSTQDQKALSFNSAVITMMLQGRRMPRGITAIAVAHELGHSFGSDHDPHPDDKCSPSDKDGGRYIMAAVAVKGDQPNNRFFSPCSIGNIKTVLRKKSNCFISIAKSVCVDDSNYQNKAEKDSFCLKKNSDNDVDKQKSKENENERENEKKDEDEKENVDDKENVAENRTEEEKENINDKENIAENRTEKEKEKINNKENVNETENAHKEDKIKGRKNEKKPEKGKQKKALEIDFDKQIKYDTEEPDTAKQKSDKKNPRMAKEPKTPKKEGNKPGKRDKPTDKKKPPKQTLQSANETAEDDDDIEQENSKPTNCSATQSNDRRVPQTECLGPDAPSDEAPISCTTAQCALYGQITCECTDIKSSCVVCCKKTEGSEDCTPIRRRDTPWWLLRRPGEPCNGDRGKCDAHGRCNVDKTDPVDSDKQNRNVETKMQTPFDGPVDTESDWQSYSMVRASEFMDSLRMFIEWFFDTLFKLLWMCVCFLFFLFIVMFICFICPAVAVGIWCLQQCTCWSSPNTIHDDDMYLVLDESDDTYIKFDPQVIVTSNAQTRIQEVRNRNL